MASGKNGSAPSRLRAPEAWRLLVKPAGVARSHIRMRSRTFGSKMTCDRYLQDPFTQSGSVSPFVAEIFGFILHYSADHDC